MLLFATAIYGCSATSSYMAGYPDPDFHGRQYQIVSVHMVTTALDERRSIEESIAENLVDESVRAFQSGDLLPPTRDWDSTAVYDRLSRVGVEAAIRISESDRWTRSWWVPFEEKTTVTTKEKSTEEKQKGEVGEKREEEFETTTEVKREAKGGYEKEEEMLRFNVELIDVPTRRVAWRGSVTMRGNRRSSVATKIVGQLLLDKMVGS